jgi:hypothetical protein
MPFDTKVFEDTKTFLNDDTKYQLATFLPPVTAQEILPLLAEQLIYSVMYLGAIKGIEPPDKNHYAYQVTTVMGDLALLQSAFEDVAKAASISQVPPKSVALISNTPRTLQNALNIASTLKKAFDASKQEAGFFSDQASKLDEMKSYLEHFKTDFERKTSISTRFRS